MCDAPFEKSGALYVKARCDCGVERDANLRFLETGRSTRCRGCKSRAEAAASGKFVASSRTDHLLRKRVNDWFQRCRNPNSQSWRNYGARGIECRFASVKAAVDWIKANLPHETYAQLDIDRIDNDGHYEPGNLRLASRKENLANRRRRAPTTS